MYRLRKNQFQKERVFLFLIDFDLGNKKRERIFMECLFVEMDPLVLFGSELV